MQESRGSGPGGRRSRLPHGAVGAGGPQPAASVRACAAELRRRQDGPEAARLPQAAQQIAALSSSTPASQCTASALLSDCAGGGHVPCQCCAGRRHTRAQRREGPRPSPSARAPPCWLTLLETGREGGGRKGCSLFGGAWSVLAARHKNAPHRRRLHLKHPPRPRHRSPSRASLPAVPVSSPWSPPWKNMPPKVRKTSDVAAGMPSLRSHVRSALARLRSAHACSACAALRSAQAAGTCVWAGQSTRV